jgi:predicted enzyme related to lactoylglutathione lyase/transcriptional regulator with XRE-family HTH domain
MTNDKSFVAMLRSELARRCAKNESYSLRAFARQLDIDHATLSQMLRGRREISAEMVERLGRALDVPPALLDAFVADAHESDAPNLAADAARILVDPIHEAILDIVGKDGFEPDSRLLARALDCDVDTVNVAVQQLLRVGLLVMESSSRWVSHLDRSGTTFDLAVWAHVSRRLAERAPVVPATRVTTKSPVSEFQILTRDPDATADFYSRLFGWTVDAANPLGYRRISTGGTDGGIWPSPPDAPSFVQLFVSVEDIDAAVSRATALGATVIVPPQSLPGGDSMAVLLDPQRISFGLVARLS